MRNNQFEIVSPDKASAALREQADIELKYSKDDQRIEGLTFPDGRVWLVDGNIETGAALGVLAHELGVHARRLGFKDERSFQDVLKRVEALAETDEQVKSARQRVPKDTPVESVNEETLAYLVSDAPQHGLVRRLISAVKRFLAERGWLWMTIDRLTSADLQALAQSAIRSGRAVSLPTADQRQIKKSVSVSGATDRVEKTVSDAQGQVTDQDIADHLAGKGRETKGQYASRQFKSMQREFGDASRKILGKISSEIKKYSPEVAARLRKMEIDIFSRTKHYTDRVEKLMSSAKSRMSDSDYKVW
ncbi:hypothetical protein GWN42_30850, partial [candidate division KSB1 bacterium]|nr:hypothetical protein [candidate division KSB1 bacterium]